VQALRRPACPQAHGQCGIVLQQLQRRKQIRTVNLSDRPRYRRPKGSVRVARQFFDLLHSQAIANAVELHQSVGHYPVMTVAESRIQ
jgi:hypothetical protein